jgi:hypothetical protein
MVYSDLAPEDAVQAASSNSIASQARSSGDVTSHHIDDVRFEGDSLALTIDGEERRFHLKEISPMLQKASSQERNVFEISPSGSGIHWPLLDEDVSIDGLLGIPHAPAWKRKTA